MNVLAPIHDAVRTPTQRETVRRLEQMLNEGTLPAHGRLPSERDLADLLDISRPTLRNVLQGMRDHELLRPASNGRGWELDLPTPAPKPSSLAFIGTNVRNVDEDLHAPGWAQMIHVGVLRQAEKRGQTLLIQPADQVERLSLAWLRATGVKGLGIDEHDVLDRPAVRCFLGEAHAAGFAVACHGDEPWMAGFDRVVSDHRAGGYRVVEWLASQGCRRLLWIDWLNHYRWWYRERLAGMQQACSDLDLPDLLTLGPVGDELARVGDPRTESGFRARCRLLCGWLAEHVLGNQQVDAVLLHTDGCVRQVAGALRLLGREPNRDILLAGYDNYASETPEKRWEPAPPAVSVDKRNQEIGARLIDLLLDRHNGKLPADPQLTNIEPELIIRQHEVSR